MAKKKPFMYMSTNEWLGDPVTHFMKTGNAMEYEFEAPNTTLGNDLLEMVKRGDVYQSSFA